MSECGLEITSALLLMLLLLLLLLLIVMAMRSVGSTGEMRVLSLNADLYPLTD